MFMKNITFYLHIFCRFCIDNSQKYVQGVVRLAIYKGHVSCCYKIPTSNILSLRHNIIKIEYNYLS